jgi:hypothetical protein
MTRQCQPGLDTPVLCHYAAEPARRPHCALTARVRFGVIDLCTPCAAARSSIGKGTAAVPLPAGPPVDVLDWVTGAHATAARAQRQLAAAVTRARIQGCSWTQIAGRLGVSRQAAQQRFGQHHGDPS